MHHASWSGLRRRWQRLPYDLKSAFATDRGFNGKPAADYCVLNCAQWNSPLYCSGPRYAQVPPMHPSTSYPDLLSISSPLPPESLQAVKLQRSPGLQHLAWIPITNTACCSLLPPPPPPPPAEFAQ